LPRSTAIDAASLGLILSCACSIRAFERFETRRGQPQRSSDRLAATLTACAAGMALSTGAVSLGDAGNGLFAAFAGLITLLGVVVVRRIGLGPWIAGGLAAAGCLVALAIAAANLARNGHSDMTLAFSRAAPRSIAMSARMLADSSWVGTGAGTFRALAPIYRD